MASEAFAHPRRSDADSMSAYSDVPSSQQNSCMAPAPPAMSNFVAVAEHTLLGTRLQTSKPTPATAVSSPLSRDGSVRSVASVACAYDSAPCTPAHESAFFRYNAAKYSPTSSVTSVSVQLPRSQSIQATPAMTYKPILPTRVEEEVSEHADVDSEESPLKKGPGRDSSYGSEVEVGGGLPGDCKQAPAFHGNSGADKPDAFKPMRDDFHSSQPGKGDPYDPYRLPFDTTPTRSEQTAMAGNHVYALEEDSPPAARNKAMPEVFMLETQKLDSSEVSHELRPSSTDKAVVHHSPDVYSGYRERTQSDPRWLAESSPLVSLDSPPEGRQYCSARFSGLPDSVDNQPPRQHEAHSHSSVAMKTSKKETGTTKAVKGVGKGARKKTSAGKTDRSSTNASCGTPLDFNGNQNPNQATHQQNSLANTYRSVKDVACAAWDDVLEYNTKLSMRKKQEALQQKADLEYRASVKEVVRSLQKNERSHQVHTREQYPDKRFELHLGKPTSEAIHSLRTTESFKAYETVFGVLPASSEAAIRAEIVGTPRSSKPLGIAVSAVSPSGDHRCRTPDRSRGKDFNRAGSVKGRETTGSALGSPKGLRTLEQSKRLLEKNRLNPTSQNTIDVIQRLKKLKQLGQSSTFLSCPRGPTMSKLTSLTSKNPHSPDWQLGKDGTFLLPDGTIANINDFL